MNGYCPELEVQGTGLETRHILAALKALGYTPSRASVIAWMSGAVEPSHVYSIPFYAVMRAIAQAKHDGWLPHPEAVRFKPRILDKKLVHVIEQTMLDMGYRKPIGENSGKKLRSFHSGPTFRQHPQN